MELTIKEYSLNESNLVELVHNQEYSDYTVRYLIGRKFGHKTFTLVSQANRFYDDVKTTMVENAIIEKIIA